MEGIVWTNSRTSFGSSKVVNYNARIGCIKLWCRPSLRGYFNNNKPRILGWTCSLYFEQISLGCTKREIPLECAQKKGEKLAIEYLLSHGLVIIRALKRTNFLEEVLSEVGIDL